MRRKTIVGDIKRKRRDLRAEMGLEVLVPTGIVLGRPHHCPYNRISVAFPGHIRRMMFQGKLPSRSLEMIEC